MNDTSWFADVVLPEASYLERYDPLNVVGDQVWLRQPVIEPLGETRSALWIYQQLGRRLGLGDFFQYTDEEDYLRQQLAPLGGLRIAVQATTHAVQVHGHLRRLVQPVRYRWESRRSGDLLLGGINREFVHRWP